MTTVAAAAPKSERPHYRKDPLTDHPDRRRGEDYWKQVAQSGRYFHEHPDGRFTWFDRIWCPRTCYTLYSLLRDVNLDTGDCRIRGEPVRLRLDRADCGMSGGLILLSRLGLFRSQN